MKDPLDENESILMKMLLQEDTLSKQRLEFLALVRKKFEKFEDSIIFLKKSIPATNPVTISLVDEMRNLYPMSTIEKVKYACIALFSALLEISLSWLDLFTDT